MLKLTGSLKGRWAILACLPLLMAACSSGSGGSAAPQTLTIWTFKPTHVAALKAVGADWAKQHGGNVNVDVQFFDENNGVYANKVAAAARAGTLPDLLTYWYGDQMWTLAGEGVIKNLTGDFSSKWQSYFNPALLHNDIELDSTTAAACAQNPDCKYKNLKVGDVYGLPQIAGATGFVFAHKSALQAAGLDPNTPPTTWDQWISMMKATVAKDPQKGGLALGLQVPETGYLWVYKLLSLSQLGPDAYYQRFTKGGNWTSQASADTFRYYDQLTPLWVPGVLQLGINQADAAFAAGNAAWDVGGTYTYAAIVQGGTNPSDLVVFPVPTTGTGQVSQRLFNPWVSVNLAITSTSKQQALALDFMKYAFSPSGASTFGQTAQDLPALTLPNPPNQFFAAAEKSFSDSPDAFQEFRTVGPQCQAAGTLTHTLSVDLTKLITKEITAGQLPQDFQARFDAAWKACG